MHSTKHRFQAKQYLLLAVQRFRKSDEVARVSYHDRFAAFVQDFRALLEKMKLELQECHYLLDEIKEAERAYQEAAAFIAEHMTAEAGTILHLAHLLKEHACGEDPEGEEVLQPTDQKLAGQSQFGEGK